MRSPAIIALAWICATALSAAAQTYNGNLALVRPVEDIRVDGDLSDWPAGMNTYPVLLTEYGVEPQDERDFQAFFRAGYSRSENALYVGVEVMDDSVVVSGVEGAEWNSYDGCEVFVHLKSRGWNFGVVQFAAYGNNRMLRGIGNTGELEYTIVEMWRGEKRHVYEWKIDIGRMSQGQLELEADVEIGFDLAVIDRDGAGDKVSWMAWGTGSGKRFAVGQVGLALMVAEDVSAEELLRRTIATRIELNTARIFANYQMFFAGVLLTFTVLHLLLFLFYPELRANLYYALYTGVMGASLFATFEWDVSAMPQEVTLFYVSIFATVSLLQNAVGLLFLYTLFNHSLPRRWWFFLAIVVGAAVYSAVVAAVGDEPYYLLSSLSWFTGTVLISSLVMWVETLRLVIASIIAKKDGALIVGPGFIAFGLACMRVAFLVLSESSTLFTPVTPEGVSFQFGEDVDLTVVLSILFPLIAMSVYLARSFARTSRQLQEKNLALEEANQQIQEATQHKSDFLARMSHDLRTPMNAIIGYTRILLRRAKDALEPRQYRNLENIQVSADHLLSLINDILDLSKIEAGRMEVKPEDVDLAQLVADCGVAVQSLVKPDVEFRQDVDGVESIRTDPDLLRRSLMNLLSNALKFTEEGRIAVGLKAVDGWVELSVADTGAGIPPEDLPHIFEEFRQVDGTQQQGTGLGLAIVRRSLELLGGTVEAVSEVGKGTTFTMRLRDYQG